MIVYGDASWQIKAADQLARLARALRRAGATPPGLLRHARCVGALIEAGKFAQGVADLRWRAHGACDERAVDVDAAMALVQALAAGCVRSWDSDFKAPVPWPARELEGCRARGLEAQLVLKRPEGYAFYALYPEAYLEAARTSARGAWQVIGLRSIGTGLAAVVARGLGAPTPITLRPKGHPFAREVAADPAQIDLGAERWALVDEGPGLSGSSMAAVARWLQAAGAPAARLHFFVGHGNGPGAAGDADTRALWSQVCIHAASFDHSILHAARPAHRLAHWVDGVVGPLRSPLQDVSAGAWRLHQHRRDGESLPPVQPGRERRKFLVEATGGRWLVKFAGLGREGERKFARARALASAGFTPEPAGLCHGFLVERWRDDLAPLPLRPTGKLRARLIDRIGDYLGFRACAFAAPSGAGASTEQLFAMGQHNTDAAVGADLASAWDAWRPRLASLAQRVRRIETDNRLHAWEWLASDDLILKTDALDHHCGHDLVGCQDLAWDLAGAAVEFELREDELRRLMDRCRARCGQDASDALLRFMLISYCAFELGRCLELEPADAAQQKHLGSATRRYEETLRRVLREGP